MRRRRRSCSPASWAGWSEVEEDTAEVLHAGTLLGLACVVAAAGQETEQQGQGGQQGKLLHGELLERCVWAVGAHHAPWSRPVHNKGRPTSGRGRGQAQANAVGNEARTARRTGASDSRPALSRRPRAIPGAGSATARRAAGSRPARRRAGRPAPPARPWMSRSRGGTSTRPRTAHRSRRRRAPRRAVRRATPPRSAPSPSGAAPGRPRGSPGRSSPTRRRGSAQASTTSARAVSTRISNVRAERRNDRGTRSPSRGSTPRRTGENQYIGSPRLARRHREQAPPVRLQQRPRGQVGADRDQVVVLVEVVRRGKRHTLGGGSVRMAHTVGVPWGPVRSWAWV